MIQAAPVAARPRIRLATRNRIPTEAHDYPMAVTPAVRDFIDSPESHYSDHIEAAKCRWACLCHDRADIAGRIADALYKGVRPLMLRLVGKFRYGMDPEEAESIGAAAVANAIVNYNPWLGWKLTTYAGRAIAREFTRHNQKRWRKSIRTCKLAVTEFDVGRRDDGIDESSIVCEQLLAMIPLPDSDLLRRVYGIGRKQESAWEVAKRMGVVRQAVHCRIARAIERLREAARESEGQSFLPFPSPHSES